MNLKQLIKEVEWLISKRDKCIGGTNGFYRYEDALRYIRITAQAVSFRFKIQDLSEDEYEDWQKLKKLLGIK